MSRPPPNPRSGGANGYTNGFYARDDGSDAGSRERRPGGYGGFDLDQSDPAVVPNRPTSLERTRANRRSGGNWNSSRSRSRADPNRSGEGNRQIEEVLQYIQQEWSFMMDEKCIPVQVGLKLLDSSSLGLASRLDEFHNTHTKLQTALKAIVNEHHQGFNSSIGTFHKIQNSLQSSQQRARALKESLVSAKSNLSTKKPELRSFANASQNYDEMLQVLNTIEQLQQVPEKLEARISEKRFLPAVDVLQDALRLIRRSDMEDIGAISDLRVYLSNQEHSITDILVEELHNHLYLKSPYCEDRWKVYAQNQTKSSDENPTPIDMRGRALYGFLDKLDTTQAMTDDASRNPEADTFHYIQMILEALNKLGRLDVAVHTIEQRLPVELFRIVERSNNEVTQRHPSIVRGYAGKPRGKGGKLYESDETRTALLNDLLWTLYARFEAIAEGHRVVHDVVRGITIRDGLSDAATLTGGFKELWKLYQSEMRSLLHDYLSTDGGFAFRSGQNGNGKESVFSKVQRDRTKKMFKLADMDIASTELAAERDDLEFILKSSVPGLVSDSKRTEGGSTDNTSTMHDGSATGHKLLVEPSVFNMGILLPPSLAFLNRLKEVVPPSSDIALSTLTSFLDDFLVNVFHPQLDETLVDLCAQTFMDNDTFMQDADWQDYSQKPIFKGTTKFHALITAFCKMLDNLPHDQTFSQLIITQMVTYYDKCYGWYRTLITRAQAKQQTGSLLKSSAAFAEDPAVIEVYKSLTCEEVDDKTPLIDQVNALLISKAREETLSEPDLINDRKSIGAICLIYTSMKWLASKVQDLRHISDRATDSSRADLGRPQRRRWTHLGAPEPRGEDAAVFLPLNHETAVAFDGVVQSYHQLANIVLRSLHIEVRCHIIHYVGLSFRSHYRLEQLFNDPDPDVLKLNADLTAIDEEISNQLQTQQHRFVTSGLGALTDDLLVKNASRIKAMNANGCGRMSLNILVLQQNLKNIESDAILAKATQYYGLFTAGPDKVIEMAKGEGQPFTYEELKVLVELYYSETIGSERREQALQAKRALNDHLLQLSEHMWQS
ncbi:hypothetical protein K490DRAFT_41238 [Saccharata proteae CBS 121410]|uniref:Exocyst complex component Sec8 n=1 Tax=Saccharata proteae CBS 121410 TaxID=1314787 RepID=A0A9P4LWX9_9PEZI|nr:hypothetical protein K490DRAFT_41238 [Saccharata proteae CBS 121410]